MGSIPTRSRHYESVRALGAGPGFRLVLVCGLLCAAIGLLHPDPALAQDESLPPLPGTEEEATVERSAAPVPAQGEAADRADDGPWHRTPVATMFKSVVFPGWGQWSNGKKVKSTVVFGVESYLIYRAVRAGIRESDARDDARAEVPESEEEEALLAEAQSWNEERRDYTWWTLFVVILSMGDAYVDAHLRGFDVEFEPEGRDVRAGLRLTF